MASFKTHFAVGTAVAGIAANLCYEAHLSNLQFSVSLWALGAGGSLLPDVDSDNSLVLKLLFNGLALSAMAFAPFWLAPRLPLVQLVFALACIYWLVRYPLMIAFQKFSRHRGVFHSLLAVLFVATLSACFGYRVLQQPALVCWLAAGFVAFGYLVHLVLDECFSVDLVNTTIKRSFGTALKPMSLQYFGRSLVMALAAAWFVWLGPPLQGPWQSIARSLVRYFQATWT